MRQLVILGFAAALAGCATGPVFQDAPPPPEGKALVYIYREANFALSGRGAVFFIDDKRIVDLAAGGYSYVYLAPGHHRVEQKWSMLLAVGSEGSETVTMPLDVGAGDVRYVRLASGVGGAACYNCVALQWRIQEIPSSTGQAEILGRS